MQRKRVWEFIETWLCRMSRASMKRQCGFFRSDDGSLLPVITASLLLGLNDAVSVKTALLEEKIELLRAWSVRFGFNLIVTRENLDRPPPNCWAGRATSARRIYKVTLPRSPPVDQKNIPGPTTELRALSVAQACAIPKTVAVFVDSLRFLVIKINLYKTKFRQGMNLPRL